MSTLDDKILGEKVHYYCSSSEDEDNGSDDKETNEANDTINSNIREENGPQNWQRWEGYSVNTGPKGVIKDWQRYKQFENEKREDKQREKSELVKKLSISCRSQLEEELDKKTEQNSDEELDDLDDQFIKEYMIKRMQEMMEQIDRPTKDRPDFGKLLYMNSGTDLLEAIDSELKFVTIICHIYTDSNQDCQHMNQCLNCLAQQYQKIKFCAIEASTAGMSQQFSKKGVPAILVYKSGALLANFVRLSDDFTRPFFTEDVENFLIDRGVINSNSVKNITNGSIRESAVDNEDLSD